MGNSLCGNDPKNNEDQQKSIVVSNRESHDKKKSERLEKNQKGGIKQQKIDQNTAPTTKMKIEISKEIVQIEEPCQSPVFKLNQELITQENQLDVPQDLTSSQINKRRGFQKQSKSDNNLYEKGMNERKIAKNQKEIKVKLGPDDFLVLGSIGKGGFGTVLLAQPKDPRNFFSQDQQAGEKKNEADDYSNLQLAIKKISQEMIKTYNMKDSVLIQRDVMNGNHHPFLVRLMCSFQTSSFIYLGMEYCEGGNLMGLIKKTKQHGFIPSVSQFILAEIIIALEYLHTTMDIMYRDVKPQNILITKCGHVQLADFGLSKKMKTLDDRTQTQVGTQEYMAPEIVLGKSYNRSVDLWALGILLYEMTATQTPFVATDSYQVYDNIITNKPMFSRHFPEKVKNLVKSFLRTHENERLGMNGFNQIKDDPFFEGINWRKIEKQQIESPISHILKIKNFQDTVLAMETDPPFQTTSTHDEYHIDQFTLKVQWDQDFGEEINLNSENSPTDSGNPQENKFD